MNWRFGILVFLALSGLLLNLLLLYWKLVDPAAGLPGCGAGNACADVLNSRWSQVFGLPVSVFGCLVYLLLFISLLWDKKFLTAFCCAAVAGSAIWFMIVQAVLLRHFCPWCLAAHAIGTLLVIFGLIGNLRDFHFQNGLKTGVGAAFALALFQLYGPSPATHRIDGEMNPFASLPGAVQAQGSGRKVAFDDGRKIYDCSSLPRLGSADARQVMVEYFDYQCPSCHVMSGYLSALVRKHPAEICILLLPVPLDHGCNPLLPATDAGHPGSCELTRIALAVWRAKPEAYPAIHEAFMSDPSLDVTAALALAHQQLSPAQLDAALVDPWIDQLIQADIADWLSFSGKTKILPKLLISGKRILHGLPSDEADFIRVMEQELGL